MPATTRPPTSRQPINANSKPDLNMSDSPAVVNPSQWLNFSMPPRQRNVPGSGLPGVPRRSRRGEGWRGGAFSRERYVHANFRFVLKPTETGTYGAHFADPDISIHWPHILQVLVPSFSAYGVAQGLIASDPSSSSSATAQDEIFGTSLDSAAHWDDEEDADRRRHMEDEQRGRMCPICLGKPVAARMTKCGHIFCFPCVLHFIRLSDMPKAAKCPICGDTIYENMLKSVKYVDSATMIRSAKGEDDEEERDDSSTASGSSGRSPMMITTRHPDEEHHDHHHMPFEMDGSETATTTAVDPLEPPLAGHRIHMRLIQRPHMTTQALPTSPTWPSEAIPPHIPPWYFLPDVLAYSRVMLATPEYMLGELSREQTELTSEWNMLKGDDLGQSFVSAAREKVERQIGKVRAELMTDSVSRVERQAREAWGEAVGGERREKERRRERERKAREREARLKAEAEQVAAEALDPRNTPTELLANSSSTFATIPPNLPVESNPMPATTSRRQRKRGAPPAHTPVPPSPSYYFYQSSLGANVFLHPLDIRILLAHFKSYEAFPPTISFRSSGFDPGTINDELRKRYKYLSHLPAGTEVVFIEAELEEIVGAAGLAAFEQPLKARKAKRRDRVKKEDRAKSKWEKAEREKMPLMTPAEDREFALALARSAAETNWANEPTPSLGASVGSSTGQLDSAMIGATGSLGSSPSGVWGSRPSFATALHSHTTSTTPSRRRAAGAGAGGGGGGEEDDAELDAAWEAFSLGDVGSVRETEKGGGGGGKKGGKKGRGKTLVLSGGMGGRRA